MARRIVTVTHPNGTKKVIVGQSSNGVPVKTKEGEEIKRPKPIMGKAGLTSSRTAYNKGGKLNVRKR